MSVDGQQPFANALRKHRVDAKVMHLDHFRVHGGMTVSTDFIILVQHETDKEKDTTAFESFMISKRYHAFRKFCDELEEARRAFEKSIKGSAAAAVTLSSDTLDLVRYCESVNNLIDSQPKQYLNKVDSAFVKKNASQRAEILNSVLQSTIRHFPAANPTDAADSADSHFRNKVAQLVETFFLTDVCSVEAASNYLHKKEKKVEKEKNPLKQFLDPFAKMMPNHGLDKAESMESMRKSKIVPLSTRERRSDDLRNQDKEELDKIVDKGLIIEPEPGGSKTIQPKTEPPPAPVSKRSAFADLNNPWLWGSAMVMAIALVARASYIKIQLPGDMELLLLFAAYCLGLHTPRVVRPTETVTTISAADPTGRKLLQRSMEKSTMTRLASLRTMGDGPDGPNKTTEGAWEPENYEDTGVPMTEFPEDAELGSVTNCWGESKHTDFKVRGPLYLKDNKKVPSGDFILKIRGIELLLTDTCPANIGKNPRLFKGKLRDVPTFIINFRLPWGVILCYFEIPAKFVPYLQLCYEPDAPGLDKARLEASLKDMEPGERCACRFFMNDTAHKNKTFKIVPVVVKGPWVVRSVVDGKPAIIGTKLPIEYVYQKAQGPGKAMYWEADLDIAASSAARGILSLVRSYTNILTLDLGFVVQGNTDDELPEQMMVGVRLHGADPMTAPAYPEMAEDMYEHVGMSTTTKKESMSKNESSQGD